MIKTNKNNILALILLVGLMLPFTVDAQYFRGSRWWKEYRREVTVAIGVSQILTDLGGRDQVGSDFIYDMELNKTRYAISAGYRYWVAEKVSIRGNLTYAMLQGDDALTNETFRNARNLNFKTPVIEGAFMGEYHLTNTGTGHRYKLKGARGKKGFAFGTYLFGGVGLFYFDPRSLDGTRLRPLHTEGQGLDPYVSSYAGTITAPKQYKPINVSFPLGIGLRYGLDSKWSLGLRFGWRFTTTDYLDDVSGKYWNKDDLIANYGIESYRYANKATAENENLFTNDNAQRGDNTDRDNFGFAQVTINYKLVKKKKYGRGRRIKTRKSMPSF